MDTSPIHDPESAGEGEVIRPVAAMLADEREKLDVARDDIAAGRCLNGAALDAWLKDWAEGRPVEVPSRRAI